MSVISEICIAERATVDPADPWTLKRVKLLGKASRNKRSYPRPIQESALPLFNGKKIYVDHGDLDGRSPINRKRSYAERVGIVVSGTVAFDPITESTYADVRLNAKHPMAEMVKADYDNETPGVGLSMAADCRFPGGTNIGECQGIDRVFSFDIVDDPATAISLTESLEAEGIHDQDKEHGELKAKVAEQENRMAEYAKRLDSHDGRLTVCETEMAKTSEQLAKTTEQFQAISGPEHAAALEQWQAKQAAAEKLVAEANKAVAESKEAFKKVPRTPNYGNPLENRIKPAAPITNGVGLQKPNFTKN